MTDEPETPPARSNQHLRANRDRSFDAALGARIRALRVAAGMSQAELGQAGGISFQQVQKYELGSDRISASMLHDFATALNAPIGSLYEGAPQHVPAKPGANAGVTVRAAIVFHQIGDLRIQRRLMALARALGEDAGGGIGVKLRKGEA